MKYFTTLLFTIILLSSFSQNTRKVYIVDENKKAIPFVHINLPDGFPLVSDANGVFLLNDEIYRDSLIYLSHISFDSKQIKTRSIDDTIYLKTKEYELDEIVISSINIESVLRNALKGVKYSNRLYYNSTRLMARNDTLLLYKEETFKTLKIEDVRVKRKVFSRIYYNVKTKDDFNLNFPFISVIQMNPYKFYQSKSKLNELIKNAFLKQITDSFYKIESKTDTTSIIMYVSRINNRLLRFKKITIPTINNSMNTFISKSNYSYDFKMNSSNTIIIKSFKYEGTLNRRLGSKIIKGTMRVSDILVKNSKIQDSIKFNSLEELKAYKQKQKLIDASLYPYFRKDETSIELNSNDSLSSLGESVNIEISKFKINSYSKEFKQKLPKYNYYMALYNQATLSYDYYPSKTKVQFDLNSVNSNSKIPNRLKKDSFNPYGVRDPKSAVYMGVINSLLRKIQKK